MKDYDALYIVDTVSSLGGDYVDVDKFGIDVCITGSQKCIAAPPGMAAITLSDDAWAAADKVDSHTFYLDMQAAKKSGDKNPPQTPCISNLCYERSIENGYGRRIRKQSCTSPQSC